MTPASGPSILDVELSVAVLHDISQLYSIVAHISATRNIHHHALPQPHFLSSRSISCQSSPGAPIEATAFARPPRRSYRLLQLPRIPSSARRLRAAFLASRSAAFIAKSAVAHILEAIGTATAISARYIFAAPVALSLAVIRAWANFYFYQQQHGSSR